MTDRSQEGRLDGLSDELLLTITKRLEVKDITKLRLACRKLSRVGRTALKETCTCLYLHPSTFDRLISICEDPDILTNVTTITLLSHRATCYTRGPHSPFYNLENHPWPHVFQHSSSKTGEASTLLELLRLEDTTFSQAYSNLIRTLKALPRLHTICFTSRPDRPGLNSVPETTIRSWTQAYEDLSGTYGGDGQRSLTWAKHTVRWTDAEVFTSLTRSIPAITRMRLVKSVRDILQGSGPQHRMQKLGLKPPPTFSRRPLNDRCSANKITAVECAGPPYIDRYTYGLTNACSHLQNVTLHIEEDTWSGPCFLQDLQNSAHFNRLQIVAEATKPYMLRRGFGTGLATGSASKGLFCDFIDIRGHSLKHIRLQNVYIVDSYSIRSAASIMRIALYYMRMGLPNLESAVLTTPSTSHGDKWSPDAEFYQMATELGVEA